jgi:hypothetical protein
MSPAYMEVLEGMRGRRGIFNFTSILCIYKKCVIAFSMHKKQLERDNTMAPELFALMEELKNKIKGRQTSSLVKKPRNF